MKKNKDLDDAFNRMNEELHRMDEAVRQIDGIHVINMEEERRQIEENWKKFAKDDSTPALRFTAKCFTARIRRATFFMKKALQMLWSGTCIIHIRKLER